MKRKFKYERDSPGALFICRRRPSKARKEKVIFKIEDIGYGFLSLVAKDGDLSKFDKELSDIECKLETRNATVEGGVRKQKEAPFFNETKFNKLERLLSDIHLYLESSLLKMKDNTFGKSNRKLITTQSKLQKCLYLEDFNLNEEQTTLIPLLTGGKLNSYELQGVKWLISLWRVGLNGVLADPVGVSKEIQVIGFLSYLKEKGLEGPYLIVTDISTMVDWIDKITRYAPSISTILYHGDHDCREKIRSSIMSKTIGTGFPIIITSFAVAINDMKYYFEHYRWKYVIIDEGNWSKDDETSNVVSELNHSMMEKKILLTSTPRRDNLIDLWSLLKFISADYFSSLEEFASWFEISGNCKVETHTELDERKLQVVAKLHSILRPFLLQTLNQVNEEIDVPKEFILYASISHQQKEFQNHFVNKNLRKYSLENGRGGGEIAPRIVECFLNKMMRAINLNYNCPTFLQSQSDVYPPLEQLVKDCGKLCLLDRLLTRLYSRNHKVVIITETYEVYHMLCYYLSESKFEACSIDKRKTLKHFGKGDTIKIQMEKFNDPYSNLRTALITTRCFEMGINFSAADTIILYDDIEWNPQIVLKVINTYQRMTQAVYVYKLATAQSVEENDILALLQDEEKDFEDKMAQIDISDEDLELILDRTSIIVEHGLGWEVVIPPSVRKCTSSGEGMSS